MNPIFHVIFSTSPISSSPTCLIFSLSSLITRLSPIVHAVRGSVYLWPRLFKFICGCQMRESIKSLGLLSLPWASANHSARVYYVSLISAVRNVWAHVLYSGVCKWLRFSWVDPWRRPACMCVCVCVCVCTCREVKRYCRSWAAT